jgi:hypothetical protein
LDREEFGSLLEAKLPAGHDRARYNHHWPHSMLGWMTPGMFAARCRGRRPPCAAPGSATPHLPQHTETWV